MFVVFVSVLFCFSCKLLHKVSLATLHRLRLLNLETCYNKYMNAGFIILQRVSAHFQQRSMVTGIVRTKANWHSIPPIWRDTPFICLLPYSRWTLNVTSIQAENTCWGTQTKWSFTFHTTVIYFKKVTQYKCLKLYN